MSRQQAIDQNQLSNRKAKLSTNKNSERTNEKQKRSENTENNETDNGKLKIHANPKENQQRKRKEKTNHQTSQVNEEEEEKMTWCGVFCAFGILTISLLMIGTAIFLFTLLYNEYPIDNLPSDAFRIYTDLKSKYHLHRVFTKEELSKYDGTDDSLPLYISIRGHVFDVSKGRKHYQKGKVYNIFAGRDATRSFSTGCFDQTTCLDDQSLDGLTDVALKDIESWLEFYQKSKDYYLVGFYPHAPAASDEAKSYLP